MATVGRYGGAGWSTLGSAAGGLAVAAYLTYTHYAPGALYCSVGDCGTVQKSEYSTLGPVPISILGMLMFVALIASVVLRARRPDLEFPVTAAAFAMTLVGVLYYIYLTYIEIWVLHAVCQWCVICSLFTLVAFVTESRRLWTGSLAIDGADEDLEPA